MECSSNQSSEVQHENAKASDSSSSTTIIDSAVMIFAAPLVQTLNQARLPPQYVGVRRIRPSSLSVQKAKLGKRRQLQSKVVFKVPAANGQQERRMTRQEKKDLKQQIFLEKKKRKAELIAKGDDADDNEECNDNEEQEEGESSSAAKFQLFERNDDDHYHQLPLNSAALEQEIADLRGERGAVPPVFLSPAMALQAQGILPGTASADKSKRKYQCMYDHQLSIQWAKELKQSMVPAESTRRSEDMRPMAYQLVPEPWSRMRSEWKETIYETSIGESSISSLHGAPAASVAPTIDQPCDWATGICRPPEPFDVDAALVFEYLHQPQGGFYVSCGAKFGSDYLVYDGPREERHAFAGMRVLSSADNKKSSGSGSLPLPTAYSLAGYVRCLNTAGKLAILATIVRDTAKDSGTILYRIAFVDVALEKILSAPTHQKRSRTKTRRDVAKNLAKR